MIKIVGGEWLAPKRIIGVTLYGKPVIPLPFGGRGGEYHNTGKLLIKYYMDKLTQDELDILLELVKRWPDLKKPIFINNYQPKEEDLKIIEQKLRGLYE